MEGICHVSTNICSLLIEKDGRARRNISIQIPCACPTVISSISVKSFHFPFPYFVKNTLVIYLCCCLAIFSSRACAFICCTSIVSGLRRRMYSSWLPMQRARIRLLMRTRGAKNTKSGAFLSIGLMINFRSLKEIFLISDHGKPIFGVSL